MTQREPHHRPFLLSRSHRSAKAHAHSLLEAELQDIRRCLARLEREIEKNVVEIHSRKSRDHQAA